MDERRLTDTPMMSILFICLALGIIVYWIGPPGLMHKSFSDKLFNDFLTVNEIEDRIRNIRLGNKELEDELAQLGGNENK